MLWKGCLQLLLIFGLFFGFLYGFYLLINPSDNEEASLLNRELLEKDFYYHLLDHRSKNLTDFSDSKVLNHPLKKEINRALSRIITQMNLEEAMAALTRHYIDQSRRPESRMTNKLIGLSQGHIAELVNVIAKEDPDNQYSLLCAYLFKDIRKLSNQGWGEAQNSIIGFYEKQYFNDLQLSIAIEGLPAGESVKMGHALKLTNEDGSVFQPKLSPYLLKTLSTNAINGGIEYQEYVERLFHSAYGLNNSDEESGLVLLNLFEQINQHSPQWLHNLFDSLVVISDDDILTTFIKKSDYVENQWAGLYENYHPEVFQFLQKSTKQKIMETLDEGIVTLLEAEIVEDLKSDDEVILEESLLSHYSELIESDPDNPDHYIERGKILAEDYGDFERSIEDFTKAINLDETIVEAYFQRSLSREKLKDIEGSIEDYDQVLNYEPDNIYALGNRGIMKHQLGDFHSAILDYTAAIDINDSNTDIYFNRALSLTVIGDTIGAMTDFDKTLSLDIYYKAAYSNKAKINIELGNHKEALDDYFTLLSIDENNLDGLFGAAYTLYLMDSLKQSEKYYRILTEEYPDEVGAFYSLGVIYNLEEEYQMAYSFLTKSIFMDTSYTDAYIQRGLTSLNQGDTLSACLDWVKANSINEGQAREYLLNYCKN